MLYTTDGADFSQNVHPNLRRRIRMFLIIGAVMLAILATNIVRGQVGLVVSLISLVIGAIVGFISSRIFHLSWDKDAEVVVGSIDTIGFVVLGLYILFEVARTYVFTSLIHVGGSSTAITFAFVSSALIFRVFGLRGSIIRVLKQERIFAA
ncbi:MAG: hypothetical protein JWN49_292 [Parcubacteria group bacterium]|nr:hypothetical protein [Parcubacteria group bacterium]